ncbi:MAG TPA: flippase-like domain-containing protein [Dehalococcoidia bacterium]|nr:flippase-like domain-containing protein [Dehalococcoidia bacterium]
MVGNLKFWIGIGISIALLMLFLLTVDMGRMIDALSEVDYIYLAPAVAMYLVSTYLRSLRWSVLLRHMKPVSANRLYPVVVVGYMANNLLPMRLGELIRSYYVGEREGVSKTSALVTVFVERVFDAITLLFFIMVIALFVPEMKRVAQSFGEESGIPWPLLVAGLSLPFIGAMTSLVLFAVYPSKTRELILWFAKLLPRRFEETLDSLIETFLLGLAPLRSMKMLVALFLLSIPIWITEAAVFFLIGLPFGFVGLHSGPGAMAVTMVLVTAITNIGSSIPAAPGGLGLFEIIARETLALGPLVSVDRSVAAAFAVVVHAVILLPMIILGQVILWTGHISLGRLSREGQRDTAQTP